MGKTRGLKKIRDTKGNFHAKMGTIKDTNGMDLTEAEDIKKRWQDVMPSSRASPDPGIKPTSLMSPALASIFFTTVIWEAPQLFQAIPK